jgi:hypothetical protein
MNKFTGRNLFLWPRRKFEDDIKMYVRGVNFNDGK